MDTQPTKERTLRWSTFFISFAITTVIFTTAFYASSYLNNQRVVDVRATQDTISTDIISLETQFELTQERSCKDITSNAILPGELKTLANQLSYMEAQGSSAKQGEVLRLKRLYSLLEIKDYLFTKQVAAQCQTKPIIILYFYSNKGDCTAECEKQGYALTALGEKYPRLRIYSFDYNLDVSALQTLISIHSVPDKLPALIIGDKVYGGYHSPADIEALIPRLKTLAKPTATSSKVRS